MKLFMNANFVLIFSKGNLLIADNNKALSEIRCKL